MLVQGRNFWTYRCKLNTVVAKGTGIVFSKIKKSMRLDKCDESFEDVSSKGMVLTISEGIVPSSKNSNQTAVHQLFNLEGQWLGSLFFWGWDQIKNTFWYYKPLLMSMFKKNWGAIPSDWRDNFFYSFIGKVWYYNILMTKKFKFSNKIYLLKTPLYQNLTTV